MKKPLQRLDSVHQKLIDTISPLNAELFSQRPSSNQWSVAEIVQHLCLVETRVLKDLEDAMSRPPQRVAFFRRLIPTAIVSIRLIRVKSPRAVRPLDAPAKDVAIENFNRARNAFKTLCATHSTDRFRHVVFKHPFLGDIDGVATISFVGYHERRHYKQIREVLRKLNNGTPHGN
ncbi:MAG: DinB family protein [Acidobacteriota bacterium]|nr:DinB family protein [Acidobacteriota bacterium]